MSKRYECPYCHRPLLGPDEACGGSLTEHRHPSAAKAVENQSDVRDRRNKQQLEESHREEEERRDQEAEGL